MAGTLTQACPHLRGTVIDLPLVMPITQKVMEEAEASNRVTVMAADVVSGPIPGVDVGLRTSLKIVLPWLILMTE
jgi:hypothetical protein